jgi:NADH-quinone oxidoreductase subunit G
LRLAAAALAEITGAMLGYLPEGGNAAGAALVGVLPHRGLGGVRLEARGLNLADMLAARLKGYLLLGAVEPQHDIEVPNALQALKAAECVVALTPYASAREFADIILPIGTFAETSGTYVNLEGRWQTVPGAAAPVGEARPGWKVLRVLANLLDLPGFEYTSSEQITDEIRREIASAPAFAPEPSSRALAAAGAKAGAVAAARDVPIYQVDAIVRRSVALQMTRDGQAARGQGA